MYCENCKNEIPEGSGICPNCGVEVQKEESCLPDDGASGKVMPMPRTPKFSSKRKKTVLIAAAVVVALGILLAALFLLPGDDSNTTAAGEAYLEFCTAMLENDEKTVEKYMFGGEKVYYLSEMGELLSLISVMYPEINSITIDSVEHIDPADMQAAREDVYETMEDLDYFECGGSLEKFDPAKITDFVQVYAICDVSYGVGGGEIVPLPGVMVELDGEWYYCMMYHDYLFFDN